jgi:predicted RNase H-like HicB family nuclease
MSRRPDIKIEFDLETDSYFIIWEPLVLSLGRTPEEALEDLRSAAHLGVDTFIDAKLKDIKRGIKKDG